VASLQRHAAQGRTYWRIAESRRINGKPRAAGAGRLRYWANETARTRLETEAFRARIPQTDREKWPAEEIVRSCRGQHRAETVFRQSQDDERLAIRPQFHWTGQEIQFQAFVCLLALLLVRAVERQARQQRRTGEFSGLPGLFGSVRLACFFVRPAKQGDGRVTSGSSKPSLRTPWLSCARSCPADLRSRIPAPKPEHTYPQAVQPIRAFKPSRAALGRPTAPGRNRSTKLVFSCPNPASRFLTTTLP
jgi:hypothetical protein